MKRVFNTPLATNSNNCLKYKLRRPIKKRETAEVVLHVFSNARLVRVVD